MRNGLALLFIVIAAGAATLPPAVPRKASVATNLVSSVTSVVPVITLTGLIHAGVPKAFFKVEMPAKEVQLYSLAIGETSGNLQLLNINVPAGKATVRYKREVLELSFSQQVDQRQAAQNAEREWDRSHTEYHRIRAELDRKNDKPISRTAETE